MPTPESSQPARLLILDAYSLAFRAFYALPEDLQTSDGTPTNAVYGFTSMVIKLLQEQSPDYIACCFDRGVPLERTLRFADYKANRAEAPERFSSQIPLIREVLRVMRIPVYELAGQEADDLIASLARRWSKEGIDVRIVSGDRDFFQLVGDGIRVLYNRRGITEILEMDSRAVEERYGVPPSKYLDLKALEGDPSDNLPGVPGVGAKTAAKLILKYGSAENVLEHASEQTPKLAQSLAAHAQQVAINKQISTLADLALENVGLDDLRVKAPDPHEISELFTSLEFRSLSERLLSTLPAAAAAPGKPFECHPRLFESVDDMKVLSAELQRSGGFAIDLVPSAPRQRPKSLGFSWGSGTVAFIPLEQAAASAEAVAAALGPVLSEPSIPKVVHGGRATILSLDAMGVELAGMKLDTRVAAYLFDPEATGLAERLNLPLPEAKAIMDAYFEQFRGVSEFLQTIVARAKADGYTTTMFGRRRYLPELGSGNPRVRAIGERQALNAPMQGTAADIMKIALVRVDRALRAERLGTCMILTVHDELVFEVPENEIDRAAQLVEREMTYAADLKVPLVVDLSFGSNWAEAKS